jgi:hypothetical protein
VVKELRDLKEELVLSDPKELKVAKVHKEDKVLKEP